MRKSKDRIRHTLLFEAIALIIVSTLGSKITGKPIETMGILSIIFSIIAMIWNYVFNLMFDLWDRKYRNLAPRTLGLRIIHALLFEAFFIIVGTFIVMWWLDISLWEAFIFDFGMSVFFLIYALFFNWAYDQIFPVPRQKTT